MSSGWPPEEDGSRWEPVRHASAVGAVHDSRAAERGYSGYARYTSDAGESGAFGPYHLPPSYDETDWYGATYEEAPYGGAAYGQGYPGEQYAPEEYRQEYTGQYAAGGYPEDAYEGHEAGNPTGYQGTSYPGYPDAGLEEGYPDGGYPGYLEPGAGYLEPGAGYLEPGAGYPEPGAAYPEPGAGRQGYQLAAPAEQDYGYQDYGDPRYGDPSYGDLAYDDPPRAGAGVGTGAYPAGHDGAAGYEDHGQEPAADAGGDPAYAAGGYGPGPGYGAPERGAYGPDDVPGYVSSAYVSGQYPPGAGVIGELSDGLPDPAATGMLEVTGMLEATGMLDSTGISDHVELFSYHPGAAEASQGFLDAPAPAGTFGMTVVDPYGFEGAPSGFDGGPSRFEGGPSGFEGGPAASGEHGTVLAAAEAGDVAGVLEGGSGFFDHVDPAGTSIDLPAASSGRGPKTGGTGALLRSRPGSRPAGRRRGRSGDRRLWFALAGVVVVFAGALAAIFTLAFPSGPGGPDHTLVTPDKLNAFIRRPALEQQMNVGQLRQDVVNMSAGQARHVIEAVYEAGDSTSGTTPQIVLFIGGNLLNASPKVSVTSFTQRFKGAGITSAGSLGGEAACVNATASEPGSVAMCAWFDNDSFGEVVSPTMNASALANTMRQIRPHVELVVRQKQ